MDLGDRVIVRLLRQLLAIVVGLAALGVAGTTTASAATFAYDAPTNERFDQRAIGAVDSCPSPFRDVRERSALPSVEARGTSTTSPNSFVATNTGKVNLHHSDPVFIGGDPKQALTSLDEFVHVNLHRDMNDFLVTKTDAAGNHMRPQRGNSGPKIRTNFTRDQRLAALGEFYAGTGAKYTSAVNDFFRQHPGLRNIR